MKGDPKASAPARASRTQTISYVDLMKPDEDWRTLPDASERRKIQNRLAQRAYRRNMRDRTREVERLKNQLKKLQEEKQEGQEAPSQTQEEEDYSGSDSGSSTQSAKGDSEAQMDDLNASTIATSEWLGRYFQAWPETTEPERAGCMDISANGDSLAHHLNNAACYSDYQLSPDFQPQIIPQPRPMLAKAQDVIPGPSPTLAHQQHAMQSNRVMDEPMFYPKAAYQMPWQNQNQRNVSFEAMANPMGSDQNRPGYGGLAASPSAQAQQADSRSAAEHGAQALSRGRESQRNGPGLPSVAHIGIERPGLAAGQALITIPVTITIATTVTIITATTAAASPSATATNPAPTTTATSTCHAILIYTAARNASNDADRRSDRSQDVQTPLCRLLGVNDTEARIPREIATAKASQPNSLLHLAVAGGHVDTLRLLLQRLDPEALSARDDRGYTALECAVMEGRTDLVALLLEHGAGGGASR
ncbi:hypothetical protein PG997_002144 [Apiospora hydei]|uniref:BZIP domain-containing protein n=1 Tax=Apiospora hydei TaxID=1337664 RepID=A0ABR1X8L5_9PEZI